MASDNRAFWFRIKSHASEGGLLALRKQKLSNPPSPRWEMTASLLRPIAADLMLHEDGFDAFIVMLHDQGHIPTKLLEHRQRVCRSAVPSLFICCPWQCSWYCWARYCRATAVIEAVRRLVGPLTRAPCLVVSYCDSYQVYGIFTFNILAAAFLDVEIKLSHLTMPYDRRRESMEGDPSEHPIITRRSVILELSDIFLIFFAHWSETFLRTQKYRSWFEARIFLPDWRPSAIRDRSNSSCVTRYSCSTKYPRILPLLQVPHPSNPDSDLVGAPVTSKAWQKIRNAALLRRCFLPWSQAFADGQVHHHKLGHAVKKHLVQPIFVQGVI